MCVTYRASGQVATHRFAGGPAVTLGYTIREQLAAIGDVTTTTSPFSARYAYNPNGTVAEAEYYNAGIASAPRYKYTFGPAGYDALNRLLAADFSAWNGAGWTATLAYDLAGMQYDRAGNITALQRYGPSGTLLDNLSYSYAAGTNHLSAVIDAAGSTAETWDAESGGFTYDATGNMVTGPAPYGMTAVTYDHRNLPLVLTANGVTSAYRYDEQGQRISKQVGGGNSEYYVLDGRTSLGVVTVDGVGSVVTWTWNLLAGDKVVGREVSGLRYYYHTDLLGSTRVVVQGATVVEAYDYDPWGVRLEGRVLAGPTKEGFTTKERDAESGLDYFGARYYLAALGRWTSVDPLVDDFAAWNGYNYTFNNPVLLADPDGQCPICYAIAVGIGSLIGVVSNGIDNVTDGRPVDENIGKAAFVGSVIGVAGEVVLGAAGVGASAGMLTSGARSVAGDVEGAAVPSLARSIGGRGVAAADGTAIRSGGRLGSQATRQQVNNIATEMESRGFTITGGGGRGKEEFIPGPGGAQKGSSYPDITATKGGRTVRVNTVDTRADGVTPTTRETKNASRIRQQTGDHLLLVPKSQQ